MRNKVWKCFLKNYNVSVEFRVILIGLQKCKHWRKWVWSRIKIVCKGNPFPSQFPRPLSKLPPICKGKKSPQQRTIYTLRKKRLFTNYYIIALSSFTFSYITQLLLLILRKKIYRQWYIHATMQSLTFSQAKFFTYANVHCKPTNVR